MAFRNPLTINPITSFPASGLTGFIQGSQLAADAIDGKTITGATIRTAAAGKRVELNSTDYSKVQLHSGAASELQAGEFAVDVDPVFGSPYLFLNSPVLNVAPYESASLQLEGSNNSGGGHSRVDLSGTRGTVGPLTWGEAGGPFARTTLSEPNMLGLLVVGPLSVGQITMASGDLIMAAGGKIRGALVTIGGSTVATPNASGNIAIAYGVTFTGGQPYCVCGNGSGGAIMHSVALGSYTGTTVTLYDAAGALITAGARRVNWTVSGVLA